MKKLLFVAGGLSLSIALAAAQSTSSGTVNQMSTDPQQNQKATGTMGTVTGQPNDVTPGSKNSPNGGVPSTTTMTGSGSNGNMPASGAETKSTTQTGTSPKNSKSKSKKNSAAPAHPGSASPQPKGT